MGKALSYCYKCSSLIREDDFKSGKAVRIGDHDACAGCAPAGAVSLKTPPPPTRPAKLSSSTSMSTVSKKTPPPPYRRTADAPAKNHLPWIIGGIVAALVVVLAIVALSGDGDRRPPPPEEPAPRPRAAASTAVPETPPEIPAARKALDAARRFAKDHPDDLSGQIKEFTSVALQYDRTPEGKEAMKETDRLKLATSERVMVGMAQLESSIKPLLEKGDFAGAVRILEAAEKKLPLSEWEIAVKNRTAAVREQGWRASLADGNLVAHWTFDEGSGAVVKDSTGHGHEGKLMGNAAWAEGKTGGGIRFDGENSWIDLQRDAVMDTLQNNSYTLALWFKPEGVPPGNGDQNNAAYGLFNKPGHHLGLAYNRQQRFHIDHWIEPRANTGLSSEKECPPDRFYHVACSIDRAAGTTQLYVDGALQGTKTWKADSATMNYSGNLWRIGFANPGGKTYSWPAKGVIDEPRMYSRALTAEEIRRVYELGR